MIMFATYLHKLLYLLIKNHCEETSQNKITEMVVKGQIPQEAIDELYKIYRGMVKLKKKYKHRKKGIVVWVSEIKINKDTLECMVSYYHTDSKVIWTCDIWEFLGSYEPND
jgi:hypothetical protein